MKLNKEKVLIHIVSWIWAAPVILYLGAFLFFTIAKDYTVADFAFLQGSKVGVYSFYGLAIFAYIYILAEIMIARQPETFYKGNLAKEYKKELIIGKSVRFGVLGLTLLFYYATPDYAIISKSAFMLIAPYIILEILFYLTNKDFREFFNKKL